MRNGTTANRQRGLIARLAVGARLIRRNFGTITLRAQLGPTNELDWSQFSPRR